MKFVKRKTFYPFPVYEFNLPSGHTCPFAEGCLVYVDRETGKMDVVGKQFRCYASASERFPAVRELRWKNFEDLQRGDPIIVPKDATHVRIHGSGDFYTQAYFDKWLQVCREHPNVKFWAFTKSLPFWINRINEIPENLNLIASYAGRRDVLIEKYGLRSARVYDYIEDVPEGMPIDEGDREPMKQGGDFALINNFKKQKR